MRNYKFRAWDKVRNRFVSTGEIVFSNYGDTSVLVIPNCEEYCYEIYSDKDFIVTQFSGKKDINRNDIYEGDMNQDGGVLIWNSDDSSFCWEYKDVETQPMGEEGLWCTITGNIYENPELWQK